MGALWNWQLRRWTTIDISSLSVHISNAAAFVSTNGVVQFQIMAPSSGTVSLSDVNSSIQIGMTGQVE